MERKCKMTFVGGIRLPRKKKQEFLKRYYKRYMVPFCSVVTQYDINLLFSNEGLKCINPKYM